MQENLERHRSKRTKEMDLAAEHYLVLKIKNRLHFWRVVPFIWKACPDCFLWKTPFFHRQKHVFERWCTVQLTFANGLEHAIQQAESGFGVQLGSCPRVSICNFLLHHKVNLT